MSMQSNEDFALHLISGYRNGYLGLGKIDRDSNYIYDMEIFRVEFVDFSRYYGQPAQDINYKLIDTIDRMLRKGVVRVTYASNTPPLFEVEGPAAAVIAELQGIGSRYAQSQSMAALAKQFNDLQRLMPTFGKQLTEMQKLKPKKPVKNLGVKTEVIIAYRDFDIGYDTWDNVWLKSRNGAVWPGYQPMIATCGTDLLKLKHDAPKEECECGIYAFDDPKHKDLQAMAIAWGEVALYGEVFICETGYRAEYAYPKTIFLRDNGTKIQKMMAGALAENYGVPVHISSDRSKTTGVLLDEWLEKATK